MESEPDAASVNKKLLQVDHLSNIRRTLGLILLVLLTIGIYFAKDVVLPLLMGTLLALTLRPAVRELESHGLAPVVTAIAMLLMVGALIGGSALMISGPVSEWVNDAPRLVSKLSSKLQSLTTSVAVVKQASDQVENITGGNTDPSIQKVEVKSSGILSFAVSNIASVIVTAMVTLVLAFFLLASGDMFYVKLMEAFPAVGDKERALRIVYGIERSVSHYLFMVTLINAIFGVVVGAGMWAIGMPQPQIWGLLSFFLNFLPFIGPMFGAGLAAAVAVVTFDHLGYAALAPSIYIFATIMEGQFITPVLLGRRLKLNTVSVFLTVIFWGWLWGVAGALLAVPFLVCFKVVCDNVTPLNTLGNFLSAADTSLKMEPLAEK